MVFFPAGKMRPIFHNTSKIAPFLQQNQETLTFNRRFLFNEIRLFHITHPKQEVQY